MSHITELYALTSAIYLIYTSLLTVSPLVFSLRMKVRLIQRPSVFGQWWMWSGLVGPTPDLVKYNAKYQTIRHFTIYYTASYFIALHSAL